MLPRTSALWVFVLTLAFMGVGCGEAEQPRKPNVLLIVVDTLRADHCSAYGYDRPTTPRMEQLAAQGVRFETAYSPAASTAPSHATMFTGVYPVTHRLVKNGLALDETFPTLAEILRDAGYDTAGIVSSFVLDTKFGLARGFDYYHDRFTPEQASPSDHGHEWEGHELLGAFDRTARFTSDATVDWLTAQRDPDKPFFLFVHYFDPHLVYAPPEPYLSRFKRTAPGTSMLEHGISLYDGEIAYADDQIGRVLDALESLGLADDTLVILTADHGEGLMDHGVMSHAMNLYEEAVRIPLVICHPGRVPAGRVVQHPAQLVDLLPTILDLTGIPAPKPAPPPKPRPSTAGDTAGQGTKGSSDPATERPSDPAIDPLTRDAPPSASVPPPLPPGEGRGEGTNDFALLPTPATSREHQKPVRAGRSLVPTWLGPAPESRDVFLHRRPYEPGLYSDAGFGQPHKLAGELFAIRRGQWKYIEGAEQNVIELFHLATDPAERHNLIGTSPPIAADLRRALHAWLAANLREAEQRGSLSPEDRARLEALGYVE